MTKRVPRQVYPYTKASDYIYFFNNFGSKTITRHHLRSTLVISSMSAVSLSQYLLTNAYRKVVSETM